MTFYNVHSLPSGKSLYTLHVTTQPEGTPRADTETDEVDVVAPAFPSLLEHILEHGVENAGGVNAGVYVHAAYGESARVVGVVDQLAGEVIYDAFTATEDDLADMELALAEDSTRSIEREFRLVTDGDGYTGSREYRDMVVAEARKRGLA